MTEKNNRITDMREWIFEAIEKIGAPMQFISKESQPIKIEDNQIPLPEDLHDLNGIGYAILPKGPWIPMRTTDSSFKEPKKVLGINDNSSCQPMRYKLPTTEYNIIHDFTVDRLHRIYNTAVFSSRFKDPVYFLKPGWLVTNKSKGFIKISYKAIATDERGYPLIPDLTSYQDAIYWYVVMKLKFPGFLNGSLGGHAKFNMPIYTYIQQQWNFYRNQAYAEAMMPTEGDMRSIKNEWNKLIPEWDEDDRFFDRNGERQLNYNDYYYGY